MFVICVAIGVIGLLGFVGAGMYLMNQMVIANLLSMAKIPPVILVAVCAVIGLLFCLNWVVLGMNCASIRKLKRRKKKKQEA